MDRRTFLALFLTALVIVLTPMVFRGFGGGRQPQPVNARPDTAAKSNPASSSQPPPAAVAPSSQAAPLAAVTSPPGTRSSTDTIVIASGKTQYAFSTAGAVPTSVVLESYSNLRASARTQPKATIAADYFAAGPSSPLLHYRLVRGADTLALDTISFRTERTTAGVTFTSMGSVPITLRYQFANDGYLVHVTGEAGAPNSGMPTQLLIDLPPTLRSQEADTLDDERHLAYGYKPEHEDVKSVAFTKLDPAFVRTDSGPLSWVAERNKYFLIAVLSPSSATSFQALRMQGGARIGKAAPLARATEIGRAHV